MDDHSTGIFDDLYVIDFGTVHINSWSKRVFEVKNSSTIDQVYKVERYGETSMLDSGFKVIPTTTIAVKPGKVFSFQVELIPTVVNMKCSDYFVIRHLFGLEATLFAKAFVEGPECSLSCRKMQIVCPHDLNKCAKKFQIRNCGTSLLSYHMAVDSEHSTFKFSPTQGKIKPSDNVEVTVSFTPTKHRLFFKRIFCLVEHHEPLVLDIFAVRLKKNDSPVFDVVQTSSPLLYRNGYHCFMNSVTSKTLKCELPFISTTVCNIDFQHCAQNGKKVVEFSMTNNYHSTLVLVWNERLDKVFTIQPTTVEIESNSSARFEASFQPSSKDKLFGTELEARLLLNDQLVPFPVDINLKGDSFEETTCGWAAQYKVEPISLILPPCMTRPFHPSHATLTIHRFGHLPLAFKFHPPENSNFTVKPEQGLIQKNLQIVVVEFQPKRVHEVVRVEKWMLTFNSNENVNQCFVEFGASIETPQLIINDGMEVVFPKAHPKSPTEIVVSLYNPTRFPFWFNEQVLKGDAVLMVGHGGEVWPHECKRVTWTFCPQGVGDLHALVSCTPVMGSDVDVKTTTVVVRGVCEETTLEVTPHGLYYEKALCGCEHERGFEIKNSGEAIISGTLMWLSGENCTNEDVVVRFEPDSFTLRPASYVLVKVFVTPHRIGYKSITIGYSLNETSATPLVPVFIHAVFPLIQVGDIRINNMGPLFTKLDVWRTLKITELNEILVNIKPERPESVKMRLPSLLCTSDDVTVELLLENLSDLAVDLKLTQEKTCACQPQLQPVSFSIRKWKDNCPHKTQLTLTPVADRVNAHTSTVLTLNVSYSTVRHVECMYNLTITPEDYESINCSVKLRVSRFGIPEETPYLDSVEPKENGEFVFNMKSVFIGDCYPFVQAFYLYNSTKLSVFYEVDDTCLVGTPFKYVGDRNTISASSNHALFFTFLPNSCETHVAFIELTIDSSTTQILLLRGKGVLEKEVEVVDYSSLTNSEILSSLKPLPVFLSTSHINVGPMKQGSAQRQVLFINNKTKDMFSFKWHVMKLPRLVELRVHPCKGAVQPGGVVECRVVAYSKGKACDIVCCLTCVCASFSKYSSTVQKTYKYREDLLTCADYFIITEGGEDSVELVPPHEDWPRKNYLTVSVKVDVKYDAVGNDSFLPFAPTTIHPPHFRDSFSEVDEEHKLFIKNIIEMLLCEALDGLCSTSSVRRDAPLLRYAALRDSAYQTDVPVPLQLLQTTMEDVLYSSWQNLFQLTVRNSTEHLRRTLINNLQQFSRTGHNSEDSAGGQTMCAVTSNAESFTSEVKYI